MIKVLHISTECFPAAKAGGMGDVLGALPKYLSAHNVEATVIIPKYHNDWICAQQVERIFEGDFKLGDEQVNFGIDQLQLPSFPFRLLFADIPSKFDRPNIYLTEKGHAYPDEIQRNIAFQLAVLYYSLQHKKDIDIMHCHDHMTGLIPFFTDHVRSFVDLKDIPKVFTIHNGQYRGAWSWDINHLLPAYDNNHSGLLDWDGEINCLACAIKCAWRVNTVSPSYMQELQVDFDTLTPLMQSESSKSLGILNGIDVEEWNPVNDTFLNVHLKKDGWNKFKSENKKQLLKRFGLKRNKPLVTFIGRFAYEKGADILPSGLRPHLENKHIVSIILGSGDKAIESDVKALANEFNGYCHAEIAYNEGLARLIYAGSDFIVMPSRFEPCGLNQMYAMRYASIPIVRNIGGLKDTVIDVDRPDGYGVIFPEAIPAHLEQAISRGIKVYKEKKVFYKIRKQISALDFSWDKSASTYAKMYTELK